MKTCPRSSLSGRNTLRVLAALLLVAAPLGGCASGNDRAVTAEAARPTGQPTPPSTTARPATTAAEDTVRLAALVDRPRLPRVLESQEAGGGRYAVIIAADRYRVGTSEVASRFRKQWNIPFARKSAQRIQRILREDCGFTARNIRFFSGPEVTRENIQNCFTRKLAYSITGPGNVLLVYYAGHGMADERNRGVLFTWNTQLQAGGRPGAVRFADTVAYTELQEWTSAVKRAVEEKSGDVATVVLVDACQVRVGAPPSNVVVEATADVTIHSCRKGQFAQADASGFLFTQKFCDALATYAAAGRASLDDVFASARQQTVQATAGAQDPTILKRRRGVVVSRSGLRVEPIVIDGWMRRRSVYHRIASAKVTFNGRESCEGLLPVKYSLMATAEGYIPYAGEIELKEEYGGRSIEIELYPSFTLVSLRVVDPAGKPAIGCTVEVTGVRGLDGYHVLESTADADGVAVLKLPRGEGEQTLVVSRGGRRLAQRTFRLSEARFQDVNGQHVPVVSLPLVVLRSGHRGLADVAVRIDYQVPSAEGLPLGVTTRVEFPQKVSLEGVFANTYENAKTYFAAGRAERAAKQIRKILENSGCADAASRNRLEYLAQQLGFWICAQAARKGRQEADAALRKERGALNGAYLEASWRLEATLDFNQWQTARERDFDGATHVFETRCDAWKSGVTRKFFQRHIQERLLEQAAVAQKDGDWKDALRYLEWAGRYRPTRSQRVAIWRKEARREFERGAYEEALLALDSASQIASRAEREEIRRESRAVYPLWIEKLYSDAMERDDWEKIETLIERALTEFPRDRELATWKAMVERASIEPATRELLQMANEAYGRGGKEGMEEAERLYQKALGDCNAYYREIVRKQLASLAERLYCLYENLAVEADIRGDKFGRFAALLRCSRYQPGVVKEDIQRLWNDPEIQTRFADRKLQVNAYLDKQPPSIRILAARGRALSAGSFETTRATLPLVVEVRDNKEVQKVLLGGKALELPQGDGSGQARRKMRLPVEVALNIGRNRIEIEAYDTAGLRARAGMVVVRLESRRINGFTYTRKNPQGYAEYIHDRTGIVFVLLPGGTFTMRETEPEHRDVLPSTPSALREMLRARIVDAMTRHRVTLSPFLLAKYEVSQAEWKRVMGSNASHFHGDDLPVETVSWNDCQEFCKKTGLKLPTEAQWEFGCRAGTKTPFSFGNTITPSQVNYEGSVRYGNASRDRYRATTVSVGSFRPNAFGLYNMHGNVQEWCEDFYDKDFYTTAAGRREDPVCTSRSWNRVCRGGSWDSEAECCRSGHRNSTWQGERNYRTGFRPAFAVR